LSEFLPGYPVLSNLLQTVARKGGSTLSEASPRTGRDPVLPTLDTDMKAGGGGAGGLGLADIRVLVAEDEAVIALDLEGTLHALGCSVRNAVASGAELLELVRRERPDVVLLDLGLLDGFAGPLAEALRAEGVPFVLSTGYPTELLDDPALRDAPVLRKPYERSELAQTLARLIGR
jgi:CheY-like chemotaxis protein